MNALTSILLYVSLFSVSALIVGYGYKKKSIVIQIIGLLIPILLGGMRYNVGLDYPSYLNAYADIINPQVLARYDGTSKLEYSFYLISYASDLLFSSPIAVFVIYSAITAGSFYRALTLFKPKKVTVALFFFYSIFFLNSFNIMRQGAAISLGCLALSYYINGQKTKAILFFLIAVAFHHSAIILLIFVLGERLLKRKTHLEKTKFKPIFLATVVLSLCIAVAGLRIDTVGNFIYSATGRIGLYNPGISSGILFKYLVCLVCLYLVSYVWRYSNIEQRRLSVFVALGLVVYSLGLVYNEAARFGIYLIALAPILYAVTIDSIRFDTIKKKILLNTSIALLCSYYLISVNLVTDGSVQYMYRAAPSSDIYKKELIDLEI